eukprot:1291828-Lingulodinium_polyedra.AAC.1
MEPAFGAKFEDRLARAGQSATLPGKSATFRGILPTCDQDFARRPAMSRQTSSTRSNVYDFGQRA